MRKLYIYGRFYNDKFHEWTSWEEVDTANSDSVADMKIRDLQNQSKSHFYADRKWEYKKEWK